MRPVSIQEIAAIRLAISSFLKGSNDKVTDYYSATSAMHNDPLTIRVWIHKAVALEKQGCKRVINLHEIKCAI
jgi:TfoX/Sxy family transcriptional regulator of competence genes